MTSPLRTMAQAKCQRPMAALALALGLWLAAQPAQAQLAVAPAVRVGNPADVGMSAARLDLLTTAFT